MAKTAELFAKVTLPLQVKGANGATLQLIEEPVETMGEMAFFGGYAEDMLVDMGMEAVDSAPAPKLRAKQA